MKAMIIAALGLLAIAPVAQAQTYPPPRETQPMPPPPPAPPPEYAPAAPAPAPTTPYTGAATDQNSSQPVNMPTNQAPQPENCGTPYEPKACPPLPRRPLQHYPENRPGH